MSGLERTMAAARRGAAWLLPADRRDWVAAVWAEAHEVPPGLERLAWRVGGVWMLARGALMPRTLVRVALFAVTATVAAWTAWPDSSVLHAAADQFGLIATVLLLAALPLLARRFFGPVSDGLIARFLRVAGYAAILALMPARAVVGPYPLTVPQRGPDLRVFIAAGNSTHGMPGTSAGGPPWPGEIFFLVLTACYVVTLLWVTSRRSSVAPATLAVGTSVGLLFGLVMYSVAPLGLGSYASNPWLRGSQVDPLVALAWILLFGGPVADGHVLHASQHADSYITMCVVFPIIGLLMSALAAACLMPVPSQSGPQPGDGGGPPGSGPGPAPQPPPPGGRLADAEERVPVLS